MDFAQIGTASSLSDASGSSALTGAVIWFQETVVGAVATSPAVVAVSWVGMVMLVGRLEVRRGLTTIAGCFVLFGASAIARGIMAATGGGGMASAAPPPVVPSLPQVPPMPRIPSHYAGASVPTR